MLRIRAKKRRSACSSFRSKRWVVVLVLAGLAVPLVAGAQPLPRITLGLDRAGSPKEVAVTLEILALLTVLSVAPAILLLMTCFTRMIVVFHFLRQALGLQQMPPNQLIAGLSLFLTFFVMRPVLTEINDKALQPYLAEQISQKEALQRAQQPIRDFMLRQTREKELALFVKLARLERPSTPDQLPFSVIVPAFVINELRIAFQIGFLLYIPFLLIDMIVASVLMSMGMLMLPPVMISLPFKVLLFVLVDGWYLIVSSLVSSFR
ncbi:MAG: flagellar type III secretion system pore protein FliP [candidate division KSB1 bacterium]|nr:flagellar type III secretion system pore protein FliP [candidate division KSB1 bacterium]